jgi:PAS domain S-box-containing protein
MDRFHQLIELLHKRLAYVRVIDEDHALDDGDAHIATEELELALEELRVAEQELHRRGDELAVARQQIVEERARYQNLFDFAPDAYLVTDLHGTINEANLAAERLLNVSSSFLIGKPVTVFVTRAQHRQELRSLLVQMERGTGDLEWEMEMKPRKGDPFPAAVRVSVALDRQRPFAIRWLIRDLSRARSAERLAAIGQVSAGLAHEARNALQRSQSCLEMLRWRVAGQPNEADLMGLLNRIQAANEDLRRMFDDVRNFAGPLRPDLEICNLSEIWRAAWDELAAARVNLSVRLSEKPAVGDTSIVADPFHLRHAFRNVLENALAASPEGGTIEIECRKDQLARVETMEVCIRDQGPGLNQEQKLRIFEPFYTTKTRGTGLGMAIVKRIIEAHGGEVALGSGGQGAEIQFILPRNLT